MKFRTNLTAHLNAWLNGSCCLDTDHLFRQSTKCHVDMFFHLPNTLTMMGISLWRVKERVGYSCIMNLILVQVQRLDCSRHICNITSLFPSVLHSLTQSSRLLWWPQVQQLQSPLVLRQIDLVAPMVRLLMMSRESAYVSLDVLQN